MIVVTGAGGFIGHAVAQAVAARGWRLRQIAHRRAPDAGLGQVCRVDDITDVAAWRDAVAGAETVVHLAARVHGARDRAERAADEYHRVNTRGTEALAQAAAAAGVRRLVFLSSIGVNGPADSGAPFTESSPVRPANLYALSKWHAEQRLAEIARVTALEYVIVRPPLVYGPRAPGNFVKLLRWVDSGLPLPFGSARNLRSIIGIDNLVDFILLALTHPRATNQTFLAADGADVSVADLVRRFATALRCPARLVPFPLAWFKVGARLLQLPDAHVHLLDSLRIDIGKARALTDWNPPHSLDSGLERMIQWYRCAAPAEKNA